MIDSSHYERLPIYKTAMDLMVKLDSIVHGFSRYHKYSIGMKLRDESLLLVNLIMQANVKETRAQKTSELCQHVEQMKFLCNAAKEVQAWKSFKQFIQVMEQVVSIARQAEGWRRSLSFKRPELSVSHQKVHS